MMPRLPEGISTPLEPVVARAEGAVTAAAAAIPVVAARNWRRLSPSLVTSPETLTSLSFMVLLRHCNDRGVNGDRALLPCRPVVVSHGVSVGVRQGGPSAAVSSVAASAATGAVCGGPAGPVGRAVLHGGEHLLDGESVGERRLGVGA